MSFSSLKRRVLLHHAIVRWSLLAVVLATVVFVFWSFFSGLFRLGKELFFGPINVISVMFPSGTTLKNDDNRTNILFLGIGPPEHDGPNLTDTMIVLSTNTASPSPVVNLISIPRDIYLDSLQGKINSAYALGGLALTKTAVTQVTSLPIHYAVRIDFAVFESIVNTLGGIDIIVTQAFDDPQYPIAGKENDLCDGDPDFKCRYEDVHFDAGLQHMDGTRALKFVRSRHAIGSEGTDFARARRQQLVLAAVKDKIFSTQTLLDPNKVLAIYTDLKSHVDTDFDPNEVVKFSSLALKYRQAKFNNIVLDLNLLDNPPIDDRGWILLPKGNTWDTVQTFIKTHLQ